MLQPSVAVTVPKAVIRQAKRYLQLLEESSIVRGGQADLFVRTREEAQEPAEPDPLREEMAKLNPDELSPREALELLYRLKKL